MSDPILYSFIRCPYAIRARSAIKLINFKCVIREIRLNNKPEHMLKVSPKGTVPILILKDQMPISILLLGLGDIPALANLLL